MNLCHLNRFFLHCWLIDKIWQIRLQFLANNKKKYFCCGHPVWLDPSPWQQIQRLMGIIVFKAVCPITLSDKTRFLRQNLEIANTGSPNVNQRGCYILSVKRFCAHQHRSLVAAKINKQINNLNDIQNKEHSTVHFAPLCMMVD